MVGIHPPSRISSEERGGRGGDAVEIHSVSRFERGKGGRLEVIKQPLSHVWGTVTVIVVLISINTGTWKSLD